MRSQGQEVVEELVKLFNSMDEFAATPQSMRSADPQGFRGALAALNPCFPQGTSDSHGTAHICLQLCRTCVCSKSASSACACECMHAHACVHMHVCVLVLLSHCLVVLPFACQVKQSAVCSSSESYVVDSYSIACN